MSAIVLSEREAAVITALKVVCHTNEVDPEFLKSCLAKSSGRAMPGFGAFLEQHEGEFLGLLSHVQNCHSALEIGSRYGKSIQRISEKLEPKSRVVSVDFPYTGGYGELPAAEPILRETIREIAGLGHETHLFLGNSHDPSLVEKVQSLGPYDFCFIDGDHSYDGVKADWENYGPHAKIVAFHDIINNRDCIRFWNEIKSGYRTVEYTQSTWLGIGIIFKDEISQH